MAPPRSATILTTAAALLGFAANSLLCRKALAEGAIDPASFTAIRIVSGALALAVLVALARSSRAARRSGSWTAAIALFGYAILFSLAYVRIPAGVGALLLFGAVQTTMLAAAIVRGERLAAAQCLGLAVAVAGLCLLLLPGASAPDPLAALSMITAGVAWAIYTLRGRGTVDALAATGDNFLRAAPLALGSLALAWPLTTIHANPRGAALAVVSGAITSGVGYALWYTALRGLSRTQAAFAQLLVPVLAALLGVLWLGERMTERLLLCGGAILAGVALALRRV